MKDLLITKGKWVNNTPNDSNGYQNIEDEYGLNVATCYGGFERSVPNAKLIISAPEMLEILQGLSEAVSSGQPYRLSEWNLKAKQIIKNLHNNE